MIMAGLLFDPQIKKNLEELAKIKSDFIVLLARSEDLPTKTYIDILAFMETSIEASKWKVKQKFKPARSFENGQ